MLINNFDISFSQHFEKSTMKMSLALMICVVCICSLDAAYLKDGLAQGLFQVQISDLCERYSNDLQALERLALLEITFFVLFFSCPGTSMNCGLA